MVVPEAEPSSDLGPKGSCPVLIIAGMGKQHNAYEWSKSQRLVGGRQMFDAMIQDQHGVLWAGFSGSQCMLTCMRDEIHPGQGCGCSCHPHHCITAACVSTAAGAYQPEL